MSIMKRHRAFASVVAGSMMLVALLANASGAAQVPSFKSRVTIKSNMSGWVFSPRRACERNRQVFVFRVRKGPNQLIAQVAANNKGRWKIDEPAKGRYYARVRRTLVGNYANTKICLADRSPTVKI